jgi:hypothetical protein
MSRICPQCSVVSTEANPFCIGCGYRFQGNEQLVSEDVTIRSASLASVPAGTDPSATFTPASQQTAQSSTPTYSQPVASSAPSYSQPSDTGTPSYSQPSGSGTYSQPVASGTPSYSPDSNPLQVPSGYMPLPQPGGYPQPAYGQLPYGAPPQVATTTTSSGVAGLQRAFAGKGVPVHHQSWLFDSKQVQSGTLRTALVENIHKQGVLGVSVVPEHLREQGVIMEERDYVKVQYGTSSVFVYIAPMGSNLYVSRISTVQQPVSRIRLVSLGSLFVLMLICYIFYANVNPSPENDLGTALLIAHINTFFSLAANGLLLFFLFVLLRSVIAWLAEKDFLAFLRPNRLNDFTLDTLSSIEHITDKGLRETLTQAGLNAEEITKPVQSYAPQQPLRRF